MVYVRATDNKVLKALKKIVRQTGSETELTEKWTTWLLNYMATHPDATLRYWTSDIILKGHSDASYLIEDNTRISFMDNFSWETSNMIANHSA